MKKRIRLSENMLNNIIKESVMEVLNGEESINSGNAIRKSAYDNLKTIFDALTDEQKYELLPEFRNLRQSISLIQDFN